MKKGLLSLLIALCCFASGAKAQIALAFDDTLICRGATITMRASVTGELDGTSGDDYFSPSAINIGFPFNFFGQTHTQCLTSGNNFITFNTALAGMASSWTWAAATGNGQVNNSILLAFQDLDLNYGGYLQYQTFGSPGSRKFVVQYCDVPKYGGSCHQYKVTNQVILYEGSNIIEFHTESMPGSPGCPSTNPTANAIQGVRYMSPTGLNEVFTPGRGPADMWGNTGGTNTSRRFTPVNGPNGITYTVDSIPYNPWYIIQSVNSNLIRWYDANGNFVHQGSSYTTAVSNPPSPAPSTFFVVEYSGVAGCNNTQTYTFRDTITIRFSDIKVYKTESMCAGSTYDFYGRLLYSPGVYDTTFLSAIGCDSVVILTLNVNPLPEAEIISNPKAKICAGDRFIFRAKSGAGYQYQWFRDGQAIGGATADTFGTDIAGKYLVKVTNASNCQRNSSEIELVIAPNPTAKINYVSETDICAMDTITLTVAATGENLEYVWTPNQYFLRTATPKKNTTVEAIVPQSGYISVTVRNNDLCTATDSVYIKAEPCCELRMPNAFTPNGDGKNDLFIPQLEVGQKIIHFQIYDRLGQMVYESGVGNVRGWDGKNQKGKDVSGGVYMYVMKYACSDNNNYEKKGDVTLIR